MVSHIKLSNMKSFKISRTLADLYNAVVWMVSTRPLISMSSTPCTKPLVTVLSALGIIVIFILHSFSAMSRYYLPTPPLGQDMTQGQFLSGV